MNRRNLHFGRIASLLALGSSALLAQGVQTGTLSLVVKDANGAPLSGVRVELKSDKLPGGRVGTTDAAGVFRAPLLPPGNYSATVSKDGFRTAGVSAVVPLGGSTSAEVSMKAQSVEGVTVTVVASASKIDKTEVTLKENYTQEDILRLPVGRTLAGITQLAPAVTAGAGGRAAIGGAATYENKFLVNGADVNDNYFNSDVGLFIEDAIDETQVLTSNVSAEYGRFVGGVVNAITKRGSNNFEGSMRAVLTNDNWNAVKPFINRAGIVSKVNTTYTFTFGGPIIKDKLWFFVAGRSTSASLNNTLPISGAQYTQKNDEKRYELNFTWQINPDHRVTGAYLNRETKNTNRAPLVSNTADPKGLSNRKDPLSLLSVSYDGILSSNLNLNVMFTQKLQKITTTSASNNGGKAFWQSPVFDNATGALFNNHYFGNDPENRDNNSIKATLTWYLNGAGTHELKIGGEQFKEINKGTNLQSPTGFVLDLDQINFGPGSVEGRGSINAPTYDIYSLDDGGFSYLEDWTKSPGGKFTSTYNSFFINDNWTFNSHFNASLGVRYESWKGSAPSGTKTANSFSDFVPRLGINYDPKGDGVWQFSVSYAKYAGKANAAIVTAGTYVGNPAVYYYLYNGPTVLGVTPSASAPGFRRSDYDSFPFSVSDPVLNTIVDPNLKAPLTTEETFGMKHKVGESGNFTMTYVRRNYTRMFEDFVGDEGQVTIAGQPYSIVKWGNVSDRAALRTYDALITTFENRAEAFGGKLFYRGNLTLSKLYGNYEGDGGNSPGGGTAIGNYEKARVNAHPYGRLPNDEPVRIKAQALWQRGIGNNSLSLGFNFDYATGKPYSLTRLVSTPSNPAYIPGEAGSYTRYYNGGRGVGRFNDIYGLDFSAQWDGRFGAKDSTAGRFGYFIKLTAFNVLNNIQQATWNVSAAPASQHTSSSQWIAGSSFGKPTSANNYVGNRQMQIDLGLRF
ncbi:MAG: TonB-dependent receptor [Holophagaceae bacterium]